MRGLSISAAWEETKAVVERDGQLFVSVALALVALPAAIAGLVAPGGLLSMTPQPLWVTTVYFVAFVISLAGQLALVRLAIGPSVTVGGAIAHGMRRMPIYLLSLLLIGCAMIAVAIPFGVALAVAGVPVKEDSIPLTPTTFLVGGLYLALLLFVTVRMLMAAAAASSEPIGPVKIIRRSWHLTAHHWWILFGFFLAYMIAQILVQLAVGATVGSLAVLLLGRPEPLSVSALVMALAQSLVTAALTTLFAVMLARIYVQLAGGEAQASVPSSGT